MDDEKKALGERVAALRKAKRLKQSELAELAGVSLGTISNLENGRTIPQGPHRREIARVLGEDVFGEGTAQSARDLWPDDVKVFTDVLGSFLAGLDPERRATQVARWMADIMGSRA
ncbi:MAG TPA: helix-turn-helix transcriptional regulator [Aeromicrobium sp.]|nr:helix-turn-helix transcriptional regulator [Aeromicrobium sp.]HKY58332.1 helix-turn-helix transcriptional regulator [Aeromicrobium sp.]